jgi:hypothetical protein
MSAQSHFAAGEPLRGGVPICFPWFGPRAGQPAHGLARIRSWELVAAAVHDDAVTVRLHLPPTALPPEWSALRTEFIVTVAEQLTMELIATNESKAALEIENCLHTYFRVGDIGQVSSPACKARRSTTSPPGPPARARWNTIPGCASRRRPTAFILTTSRRWKFTMNNGSARSAWKNSIPNPPSSGIRGRRRNCRMTSTRRNTGRWSAWNPAT